MKIEASTLTLAGQILADGLRGNNNGNDDGGGGAGGSLWIVVETLASGEFNAGYISASGGDGYGSTTSHTGGSGGGGGRIAIYTNTKTFSGSIVVEGGGGYTGAALSEAGTLYEE